MIPHMWNLKKKMIQINLSINQKQIHRLKNEPMVTRVEVGEG